MAFDLYLAGAPNKVVSDFLLTKNKSPKLLNQVSERRAIGNWVEAIRTVSPEQKLFVDSGAYLTYSNGKEVDVDNYISYANENMDAITIFAPVDKIPGVRGEIKTKEQILEAPTLSWENYLYMRERVSDPDKLIPVFHRREDFKWLKLILESKFDGKQIPYMALAPTTDSSTPEKKAWLDKVFAIIKTSSNPNIKTHLFGATSTNLLELYPLTSADSTAWCRRAAFGMIMTKFGDVICSEISSFKKRHINYNFGKDTIEKYVNDFGFELRDLIHDNLETSVTANDQRSMFNAVFFKDWSDNYEYKGKNILKKSLF